MMSLRRSSRRIASNSKDVEPHQKNRCFPEVTSMYPEYCRTEGSQILGLVILRL